MFGYCRVEPHVAPVGDPHVRGGRDDRRPRRAVGDRSTPSSCEDGPPLLRIVNVVVVSQPACSASTLRRLDLNGVLAELTGLPHERHEDRVGRGSRNVLDDGRTVDHEVRLRSGNSQPLPLASA